MAQILKRTSFGLVRTNPRLTTNIKIVVDSKDSVFLESFDADPILSKSIYKGYKVKDGGSYSFDVKNFFSQNSKPTPKDIAYKVYEKDLSTEVKDRYGNQYDFTYDYGMRPKNSRLYTEEFSLLAPVWLEKDNLPDYFLIFKMDGPVTFNTNTKAIKSQLSLDLDLDPLLETLTVDPTKFFENYIQKARIVKTFDLTKRSALGKYIRNHVEDPRFPESSLYMSFLKENACYWQGMSYDRGGFCSISDDIYKDYVLSDKTIIESEAFITDGFKRNGVIIPNILNLEFLFDDEEQEDYKFSRYFGLYVNEAELGKFIIDSDRLYQDKDAEDMQLPRPIINNIGNPGNREDQIQTNPKGIKVYPNVDPISGSPFSGRLLSYNELQNPRFGYVKDTKGNFYSVDSVNNWESTISLGATSYIDTNYLRLKNTSVNWKHFGGYDKPSKYIPALATSKRGRPSASFRVVNTVTVADEIRVRFTDWTNPEEQSVIDFYTVEGSSLLPAGEAQGLGFSINGTNKDVAKAIAKAINNIESYLNEIQIFSAISVGDRVIVFSKVDSENWNKLKLSLFSNAPDFPFAPDNTFNSINVIAYQPSPVSTSPVSVGKYFETAFTGGNNNSESRIIVEKQYVEEFKDNDEPLFIKTKTGFDTISDYSLYTDKPITNEVGQIIGFNDIDKYVVLNLTNRQNKIDLGSSSKVAIYAFSKCSNGYLSILPIKDFDFDFFNSDYTKDADSSPTNLWEWYKTGPTGASGISPVFDYYGSTGIGANGQSIINELIGPTSAFVVNGGFQTLAGLVDQLEDSTESISTEYDRLKENDIPETHLPSRVVPYITKWVYDNESTDVRENGYRLTTDQSFGNLNFSPSFDEVSPNTKYFTHEWYYLQQYPPYMSFDDKVNSFSYFDEDINSPYIPVVGSTGSTAIYQSLIAATGPNANLLSIEEDYFKSYFTRETVSGIPIKRDFKYSIFSYGNSNRASETLFRGIKLVMRERGDKAQLNFDIESKKLLSTEKFNDYKFSAVLTYSESATRFTFIKNDKWKTVTLLVQAPLDNALLKYEQGATSGKFIDRSSLYTIKSLYKVDPSGTLSFTDTPLSGSFLPSANPYVWFDNGTDFEIFGVNDINGQQPNFISEITQNDVGGYNSITITDGFNTYIFDEIFNIQPGSFRCQQITLPGVGTITPDGTRHLNSTTGYSTWPPAFIPVYLAPLFGNPSYIGGGFNGFVPVSEEISLSNIAFRINSGDPNVRYIQVSSDGIVSENDFHVELVKPDYSFKGTYLKTEETKSRPKGLSSSERILGFEIAPAATMSITEIARNRGGYNPRFKDILCFIDTDDIKAESLDYLNVQILTDVNGYQGPNLGFIRNLYHNKVNTENPNIIFRSDSGTRSIFPKLGQVAIAKDDFFVFKSNWDPYYYRKYLVNRISGQPVIGTRGVIENKSFFGSKIIAIPNTFRIEKFDSIQKLDINEKLPEKITALNRDVPLFYKDELIKSATKRSRRGEAASLVTKGALSIRVFTEIQLAKSLIASGFGDEFKKYVDPNFSFGETILDDDIRGYITANIFDRYVIKEVIVWEKIWNKGNPYPQINFNLSSAEKADQGYVRLKNIDIRPLSTGSLNFDLIYRIPTDKNYSLAIDVVLEKK